jgi:CBS-domain-containing membrane protein
MWLTASLSVSISIVLMQLTLHPGGATALIAVTGSEEHGILVCNYACTKWCTDSLNSSFNFQ